MGEAIVDARDAALAALLDDMSALPPGRTDLAGMLIGQLAHRQGPHAWTLGCVLVDPAAAVGMPEALVAAADEVAAAVREQGGQVQPIPALPIAVVLTRSGSAALPPSLDADLVRLAGLARDPHVELQAIEVPLSGSDTAAELTALHAAVDAAGMDGYLAVRGDIPLSGRPAGEVVKRIEALAAARRGGLDVSATVRMSGPLPGDVPSTTELAGFLRACNAADVPLRTRGGGPVTRPDGGGEHGILNLLAAAVVATRRGSLAAVRDVLEQPANGIRLGSGALIVGDVVLESEVLAAGRAGLLPSMGCTDLDGVLHHLTTMGAVAAPGTPS